MTNEEMNINAAADYLARFEVLVRLRVPTAREARAAKAAEKLLRRASSLPIPPILASAG